MIVKNILFDFDGVILDSNNVKDEAFRFVLREYSNAHIQRFLNYHKSNGGVSRYEKIKFFFEEILNQEPEEHIIRRIFSEFSAFTLDRLVRKDLIIQDTFEFISGNKFNYHIVSATDESDLFFICEQLGLKDLFRSIHGSPKIKSELILNTLRLFEYRKEETVLIGDSINDFYSAADAGIVFYGYNNPMLKFVCNNYLNDYRELESC